MKTLAAMIFLISFSIGAGEFSTRMKPFLEKYCISCHGPTKQKSGLRLDQLSLNLDTLELAEKWQHILDELNGATMPPEDEPQPTKNELSDVLEVLTIEIQHAEKMLYGKDRKTVIRRMNQRDYINTIYELTGVRVKQEDVPEDGSASEFDTNGKGLYMSSYQFEKYFELGKKVIARAIEANEKSKMITHSLEPEIKRNMQVKSQLAALEKGKSDNKRKAKYHKRDIKVLTNYTLMPAAKVGGLISEHFAYGGPTKFYKELDYKPFKRSFEPGVYKFSIVAANGGLSSGDHAMLTLDFNILNRKEPYILDMYEVSSAFPKLQTIEFELEIEEKSDFTIRTKITRSGKDVPYIMIDKISISGPHKEKKTNAAYGKLFPENKGGKNEEEYATEIIKNFAVKAFKFRKPTAEFLQILNKLYRDNRQFGMPMKKALQEPLAVILASPQFLYLVENAPRKENVSDIELASRLSYFLWSSPPDITLIKLANKGSLSKPEVLRAQVIRMLKDPKSFSLAQGFVPQWLDLEKIDEVDVNRAVFKNYDKFVKESLKLETQHFFHTLLIKNMSVLNFIDSNFTVLNNVLKDYYGFPSDGKDDFEIIRLPKDSHRGGLLGQGAIHVLTGNGERTSPVLRGAFILSKILGMPSPEPPPNVPQLESTKTEGLSVRAALKIHQEKPQCSSCHKRIDPLGFGLENFNAAGLWQEKSLIGKRKKKSEVAIDSSGKLPNGQTYKNLEDLKKKLLSYKKQFTKSLAENLAEYALGREIGFADAKFINSAVEKTQRGKYRLGNLVINLVLSPEFRQKQ